MQYQQLFLLTCLLGLPVISAIPLPQVLFRDSALVHQASHSHRTPLGLVSHNSHSVQDSNSAVHRHHTQATNHAGRLHQTLLSSPLPQVSHSVLQAPSLVQHADGRFFAVNANIQPGQFFQTADGRIFTLTNSQTSLVAPAPLGPSVPSTPSVPLAPLAPVPEPSDENVIIAAKDSSDDDEPTVAPVMETTLEPVTEAQEERTAPISQPQTSHVIATAPFTTSTARFVSAVPAISQAPIPVTHISHNSPFLTNFAPSSHIIQDLRSVQAVPTSQLGHAVHVLPARVPISHATAPSLVQHADGRFFAVNTNIQPGQFFQNADGRIFRHTNSQTTLVAPAPSAPVAPTTAPLAPVPVPSDDNAIIAAKDSSDDVEAIGVAHVMETTLEPVTEAPAERADPISQPQTARVIATAPFTASTARFVSAVPAISQAPIPVTHISHNSPFLTNFAPSSHIIQDLRSVQAVPTSQLGHAVLPARVPISPATRGHLLADSSTNVFTGYFSSPNYGIDFNF